MILILVAMWVVAVVLWILGFVKGGKDIVGNWHVMWGTMVAGVALGSTIAYIVGLL